MRQKNILIVLFEFNKLATQKTVFATAVNCKGTENCKCELLATERYLIQKEISSMFSENMAGVYLEGVLVQFYYEAANRTTFIDFCNDWLHEIKKDDDCVKFLNDIIQFKCNREEEVDAYLELKFKLDESDTIPESS